MEVLNVEAGVRNKISGTIEEIKCDGIMAEIKMRGTWVGDSLRVTSVMTKESLDEVGFKIGDNVNALIKAINVVFVKQ